MLTYLETLMTHPNVTLHNHNGVWHKLWSRMSSLGFCNKSSRSSWTVQLEQQHSQTLLQRNPSSPFLCQRMSAADAIPLTKKVKQNRKRPRCCGVQPTLNGHLSTPPPFFVVNSILIFILYAHTHYYYEVLYTRGISGHVTLMYSAFHKWHEQEMWQLQAGRQACYKM